MANDNQSRDNPSRQQSAERSQTGSAQQGTGAQQTNYGQGSGGTGQGGYGQSGQSTQGGGRYGGQPTSRATGVSTWQGGRQGRDLARGSSMSPYYGGGFGSGPFSIMRRISDEMDRLFENFGMGRSLFPSQPSQGEWNVGDYNQGMPSMWTPHVEVRERNGKLVIEADLPGMKRDDISVRVEDDEVILQGERRQESSGNQGGYYRSERTYGSFYRTIPLPEGTNADTANATFRDGVLEVEFDMPRGQQRGRTLQIREGSQSGGSSGTGSGATYGSGTTGSLEGASSGGTGTYGSGGTMHTGANPSSGPMHGGSTSGTGSATTQSQHAQSGTGGSYGAGMSGGTGTQHSASGGASGQQSQSGSGGGSQQSSGSGTMYSGSGNPSVGAAGIGASHAGSSDKARDAKS
ncbi:MAG TPA: Hsp20/alpha crystallin family protein [Casimicrobiaceae bacterium]|nr:Hsp20/alpha crystallin family protein [Casimicrobiaceae bacterium]